MGYAYAKRRTIPTANVSSAAPKTALPGISNSSMLSIMGYQDKGGLPNLDEIMKTRVRALHNQIPAAESEADRLSEGVSASSPEWIKEEMGERLGADFSSVRFHSDAASARQADRIGARAWTQGSDVYFGEGGFEPSVAAHELVHTVQQGAASGEVSQSVPMGAVQMAPTNPWEITQKQLKKNKYNPTGDEGLQLKLEAIDGAGSFQDAYRIFLNMVDGTEQNPTPYTENMIKKSDATGKNISKNQDAVETDFSEADLKNFKAKLKNMMRMVNDFPELKGKIGYMRLLPKLRQDGGLNSDKMNSSPTEGGTEKSIIGYNPTYDEHRTKWQTLQRWWKKNKKWGTATRSYDGTHELGHVLNSLVVKPLEQTNGRDDWTYGITANEMLEDALKNTPGIDMAQIKRYTSIVPLKHLQGHINTKESKLDELGQTSEYGATDASELFAEAFADVYAHGDKARPLSIELVKRYSQQKVHQDAVRAATQNQ